MRKVIGVFGIELKRLRRDRSALRGPRQKGFGIVQQITDILQPVGQTGAARNVDAPLFHQLQSSLQLFFPLVQLGRALFQHAGDGLQLLFKALKLLPAFLDFLLCMTEFQLGGFDFFLALTDVRFEDFPNAVNTDHGPCVGQGFQRRDHGVNNGPVFLAVAVFRGALDADACLHKSALQAFAVEGVLLYEDIRRDRNHVAEMVRSVENPRDFKVMLRKRVHIHDRITVDREALADGEPEILGQIPFHGAFAGLFRHAALQQHRKGYILRQGNNRDRGFPVVKVEPGVNLPDRLRLSDARDRADLLQILVGHEHGGCDLHIPKLTVIEEEQRVLLERRGGVGDTQISHGGQKPDHYD